MANTAFRDPSKQEVWTTLRAMNDAWTKGNPDDLAKYFHPDMVVITGSERNRIEGAAACIASWKGFASAATIHRWEEIDPVIHLYGNSAVVAYYFDMSYDMGGKTNSVGGRDLYFFVKEGGKWLAVAGQGSLYPASHGE